VTRVVVSLVLVALEAAECQRTPAEDFAARPGPPIAHSISGPAVAERAGLEGRPPSSGDHARCVRPSPPEPPPPVRPGPAPGCPADPEGAVAKLPRVRVTFRDVSGVIVDAELVRTEHDSMRGLMYRKSLEEERGMLFDLHVRDDHKFWMHNTCISLDLLYVDEDGLIVGIVENAPTLDDETRGVDCPSRWVLEVNAGWARRHGVKAGQHMSLPAEAIP
jgi:uncharacterized membrane protein (UPF0127 family)